MRKEGKGTSLHGPEGFLLEEVGFMAPRIYGFLLLLRACCVIVPTERGKTPEGWISKKIEYLLVNSRKMRLRTALELTIRRQDKVTKELKKVSIWRTITSGKN